jgi:hypothetical protein
MFGLEHVSPARDGVALMRTKIVTALALFFGVVLILTGLVSMVQPDLTGGRSFAGLFIGVTFLSYGVRNVTARSGANPPPAPTAPPGA